MPQDGRVPGSVREAALHDFPKAAMHEMVADEQDLAEERAHVVRDDVGSGGACLAAASVSVDLCKWPHPIRRVEESAHAIQDDPTRIQEVDTGVREECGVRRGREARDAEDFRRA
jgi:hypothetical protein